MNNLLQRLMKEATRLTKSGQLHAATEAIQRALRSDASPTTGPGPASHSAPLAASDPARSPVKSNNSGVVIDGYARFIDESVSATTTATTPVSRFDNDPDNDVAYVQPAGPQAPLESQPERWTDGSFNHQGRTLAYKLYVPARPAGASPTARPLVLMLHGCTQNPADFAAGTQMNALAREQGFVVLYPQQTQHANAQKCWNWFKPQHQRRGHGEPAVLAALTQAVMAEEGIDPARVYVAGLSAGGAMADIMGRCYPDLFAAVGVHSGLPSGAADGVMSALSAMRSGTSAAPAPLGHGAMPPVIVFHGDADATVHPRNGASVVSAARGPQGADDPAPRITQGSSAQGQRYTQTVYTTTDGEGGRQRTVEHWLLHGAGHAWSGGSAAGSYTDPTGTDASVEMMRFFMAHPGGQS